MDDEQRKRLAKQVWDNPITHEIINSMEKAAIDLMVYAKHDDDKTRIAGAAKVRAVRDFRSELSAFLEDNQPRKKAPA